MCAPLVVGQRGGGSGVLPIEESDHELLKLLEPARLVHKSLSDLHQEHLGRVFAGDVHGRGRRLRAGGRGVLLTRPAARRRRRQPRALGARLVEVSGILVGADARGRLV
eukprot:142440-Pleurochrysis_carterae.AAC.2